MQIISTMDFEYERVTMSEDDNLSDKDDRLIQRYDTILKESALLTTFSAILFGFILNISVNTHLAILSLLTL